MKIALLTAGGIAPCLSASIGRLIQKYTDLIPDAPIIGYLNGYKGLLLGHHITISENVRNNAERLYNFGGSPLGNSRVKLTNVDDCIKKGYITEEQNPLHVAAEQLKKDKVSVLHTIGGDDTNTMAAKLEKYLRKNGYELTVVGLPKTVDNDVFPIHQTLGAWTAAEQGAIYFENVVNESTTSSRQLIIHEVMGRNCGWLTAATAQNYRERIRERNFLPDILLDEMRWDVDSVYIPEVNIDINSELDRLLKRMDEKDGVNIFLSEGAGRESIVDEMIKKNEKVPMDAFGHVRLDEINPGLWFAKQFSKKLGAEKVLVQKSGYFARSATANSKDLDLIIRSADMAADCSLKSENGVIGLDEDQGNRLRCIEFERIKGGKPFDVTQQWFIDLVKEIGQKI